MARILLGVSGGIAAYKALELVRLATGAGHSVRVVQTPNSRRFVGEASFAADRLFPLGFVPCGAAAISAGAPAARKRARRSTTIHEAMSEAVG